MSMCVKMRVSRNYPYFLSTERSYFQNRLASAYVLFHYSLGTHSPTPLSFFPPLLSCLLHWRLGADSSSSLRVSSPGSVWLHDWWLTAYASAVRAHFVAGQSLPWPHFRLWIIPWHTFLAEARPKRSQFRVTPELFLCMLYMHLHVYLNMVYFYIYMVHYICAYIYNFYLFFS